MFKILFKLKIIIFYDMYATTTEVSRWDMIIARVIDEFNYLTILNKKHNFTLTIRLNNIIIITTGPKVHQH